MRLRHLLQLIAALVQAATGAGGPTAESCAESVAMGCCSSVSRAGCNGKCVQRVGVSSSTLFSVAVHWCMFKRILLCWMQTACFVFLGLRKGLRDWALLRHSLLDDLVMWTRVQTCRPVAKCIGSIGVHTFD